jgi:hypothetical protein
MNLKNAMGVVVLMSCFPALAQQAKVPGPSAPPKGALDVALSCPAGSKQVGGAKSPFEASLCMRLSRDGSRIFHGPYVAFWSNGQKQAEGQYDEGMRAGKWVFFDESGVRTGETVFRMGDYDGLRVEFFPNGQKKLEETYAMGRRQGAQVMYDLSGKVQSKLDFIDDRPVQSR